jgi:peptidyl-prolyl cis-trans isomerase C
MRILRNLYLAVPLAMAMTCTGCRGLPDSTTDIKVSILNWLHDLTQSHSESSDPVLAEAGSIRVLASELPPNLPTAAMNRSSVQRLVQQKRLASEGRKAGVGRDPLVRSRIEEVLAEGMMKRLEKDLAVTDDQVRLYYDTHPQEFKAHVVVLASQIVLRTRAEAEAVKKLTAKMSFGTLAHQYSIDPFTAKEGGHIPPFLLDVKGTPYSKVLATLKDGQISGIISTPRGFMLIRKDGRKAIPGSTFEQVKVKLRMRLTTENIEAWKKQTFPGEVHFNEAALSSLNSRTAQAK